jgi:hypothetical protein
VQNNPTEVKCYVPQEDFFADVTLSKKYTNYYEGVWIPDSEDYEFAKNVAGDYIGYWQLEIAAKTVR